MLAIAFTGMPWSGKSEAVKIAKEKGFYIIRMGDFVWYEVRKRGLELNSENVGLIANEMRDVYGKDIWAKKTLEKIKSLNNEQIIIIDGIRSTYELNCFKSIFNDDFILVAVKATDENRHNRAVSRKRKDDTLDIELVKKRDEREKGWGISDLINKADITLSNNDSMDSFNKKIYDLFESMLKTIT
jgi:dephospho-CoA kinase